jgi:hypothetical protein
MSYASRLLVLSLCACAALLPTTARAQQPGAGGPPLPVAVDLRKVPVGAWADYTMSVGKMPPMKSRMALVAKAPATSTVEMTIEGGMMATAGGTMIMQSVVDADTSKASPVKKLVMQIGPNDPMEMPIDPSQQKQFQKPNPKSFVKQETIKVAGGTFKTKHYRDKTAQGDVFDFWISEEVHPFGLVKIEGEQKSGPGGGQGPIKFELVARGKDAKSAISKAPKPFDQAAFMAQIMGGAKGPKAAGGKPGGPPAAAPSGPAPGSAPAKK